MRERLAKLSCVSDRIRRRSIVKKAGLLSSAVSMAGKWAAKNPVRTAIGVGTAGLGAAGTAGTYRKNKTKFDPEVSRRLMGETPEPPGS